MAGRQALGVWSCGQGHGRGTCDRKGECVTRTQQHSCSREWRAAVCLGVWACGQGHGCGTGPSKVEPRATTNTEQNGCEPHRLAPSSQPCNPQSTSAPPYPFLPRRSRPTRRVTSRWRRWVLPAFDNNLVILMGGRALVHASMPAGRDKGHLHFYGRCAPAVALAPGKMGHHRRCCRCACSILRCGPQRNRGRPDVRHMCEPAAAAPWPANRPQQPRRSDSTVTRHWRHVWHRPHHTHGGATQL